MRRPIRNVAASIHQRLKNHAVDDRLSFNDVLQHFVLERFLYRLGQSTYADAFVLKGALLLRVWRLSASRSTRDIDLLGAGPIEPEDLIGVVHDVCGFNVVEDGLRFDLDSISVSPIAESAHCPGSRLRFSAILGDARIPMQVDVGFGDPIIPGPELIEYPTILPLSSPRVLAYPRETAIAEKFHVILQRGNLSTRMKDWFDIWALAMSRSFDGAILAEAINATCAYRGTPVDAAPDAFRTGSMHDPARQRQWMAFLRRLAHHDAPESFHEAASVVETFLGPIAKVIARRDRFASTWPPGGPWT